MNCIRCQSATPEGANFCPKCGNWLPAPKLINPPLLEEQVVIRQIDPVLKAAETAKLLKISRYTLDGLQTQNRLPHGSYFEIPTIMG